MLAYSGSVSINLYGVTASVDDNEGAKGNHEYRCQYLSIVWGDSGFGGRGVIACEHITVGL